MVVSVHLDNGKAIEFHAQDSFMRTYDYVVIGSGIPGMTLKRFLNNPSVVLIDPNPCG